MTGEQMYGVRAERTSWKSLDLIHEARDHEGVRMEFDPPIDLDAQLETLRQAGWSVERKDDGTRSATPPSETPPRAR